MSIMSIVYFVIVLSVIVFVHELGHFICAKHFGVYCAEFSLGMGPALYKKQIGETTYALRALPIGGFVQMAGEEGEDFDVPFERTIKGIKVWKQVIVMAAGAIMNILLAWVIMVGITMYQGAVREDAPAEVIGTVENSPAELAGFQSGDLIKKVTFENGDSIVPDTFNEILIELQNYPKDKATYQIDRDGKNITIQCKPAYLKEDNRYYLGVNLPSNIKKIAWYEAFNYGTKNMLAMSTAIFDAFANLIRGIGLQNLAGPVGIFEITAKTVSNGFLSILNLLAMFSLNIGIFNLIPIPVMDGGRIVITVCEKISGRKMSERFENGLMMTGVVLLIGLMLFATWNDISRIFF
ncbi:MAG: RIP metalloprotease RseP [Erysipelotrichaceae bacterium]